VSKYICKNLSVSSHNDDDDDGPALLWPTTTTTACFGLKSTWVQSIIWACARWTTTWAGPDTFYYNPGHLTLLRAPNRRSPWAYLLHSGICCRCRRHVCRLQLPSSEDCDDDDDGMFAGFNYPQVKTATTMMTACLPASTTVKWRRQQQRRRHVCRLQLPSSQDDDDDGSFCCCQCQPCFILCSTGFKVHILCSLSPAESIFVVDDGSMLPIVC